MFKKILVGLVCLVALFSANTAFAYMPEIYPQYGYNAADNYCQILQLDAASEVTEGLTGKYYDLRECRRDNPKTILNTGSGILIWAAFLFIVAASHKKLLPKLLKGKKALANWTFQSDLTVIAIFVFFAILLQHYFSVPEVYYDYGSDLDDILYMNFIGLSFPNFYFFAYLVFATCKTIWIKKMT